ncbi:sulfatase-like hydrolase/transferase [Maribellus comscasis]|uniref:Sulfatase-like hydrolase/transferase n=1 Tax=Maribellus comscasis TaxID=2681766 RepID=A0A6I6JR14_9BACT|nr:arylsulfatase [Maribellus comscasis]QGY42557.1 sulfatase-like hydrolase/transferase [Maribellus comscasis]
MKIKFLPIMIVLLASGGLLSFLTLGEPGKKQTAEKPNVIIIMTDDQGYPELSIHDNPVLKTPNLDKFAESSVRFGDFHAAPMCAPTRGQLMTGMDAAANGCVNVSSGRAFLKPGLPTMGNIFMANGYNTGIFGKWHLGANYPYRPQDRGFEESVWFPSSHIGSVSDYWGNDYFDDTYRHNGELQKYNGYCTDVFFGEAKKFIESSLEEGKPFFVYIPTNTPHGPFNAKEEDIKVLEELYDNSTFPQKTNELKKSLVRYLAMIRNIDTNVGSLLDFLDKKGVRDNTIVVFLTDNGSIMGIKYFNAGMRGMKTELWDGGHRVPCFINWPKGNFENIGEEVSGLAEVQDILPTFVDLCDLNKPTPVSFDGMSLAPVLRGEEEIPKDRMLITNYSRMPNFINYPAPHGQTIVKKEGAAVLWKGWRLLESRELYNRITDPLEKENVFGQNLQVVRKMEGHLDIWWDRVKKDINEPQKIIIGSEKENPTILTACDWLDVFIDQQPQVSRGERKNSYWCLDVAQEGDYEIELRRWPKETDSPIAGECTMIDRNGNIGGTALPIVSASIYIGDVELRSISEKTPYGFEGLTKEVTPEDKAITFDVHLKPGPIYLHTFFHIKGQGIIGAYYAYVTRM